MNPTGAAVLELLSVSKQYGALRPLRIERLSVSAGDQIALLGLDQPAAEIFINLVTGATLPDAGEVRAFGRPTADIANSEDWLASLDRFGIVSDRAVLLEQLTVVQNLAVPFSLEIEPPPPGIRDQAVALAGDVRLNAESLDHPLSSLDPTSRFRVRLARAVAHHPSLLLLEHPSAMIPRDDVVSLAHDIRDLATRYGASAVTLTMDSEFAGAVAQKALTLEPASGRLRESRFGRIRFWS